MKEPAAGGHRPYVVALAILVLASLCVRGWLGSVRPDEGRFWDEQFAVGNSVAWLEGGGLEPANAFHPSLAHQPQAVILASARHLCARTFFCDDPIVRDGGFTPLAYRLARWTQAIFGSASLVVVFLVGRRLFGPAEGLLAAALLAMVPWHVRQSAIFKPDILLLLLTVVALAAALWVARCPRPRRYAVAGAVAGLAASAKYIGLTAGFLLLPGTLLEVWRRPRRLLWLVLATAAGLGVFFALNPYLVLHPDLVVRDFSRTLRDYQWKGTKAGTSGLDLVIHAATTLASPSFHGPVIGAAGLLGLALLAVSGLRGRGSRRWREERLLLAGFPALYTFFYAAATTNPSPHNWLPLAPFTSLGAAWLAVAAARRLGGRLSLRVRRPVAATLMAACLALSLGTAFHYTYFTAVPTTYTLAERYLTRSLLPDLRGRLVIYDRWQTQRPTVRLGAGNKAATVPRSELAEPWHLALARADAAVLRRDLPEPADSAPPAWGQGFPVHRFEARAFRAWGPSLVVVVRPWRRLDPGQPVVPDGGRYRVDLAGLPPGAHLSFLIATDEARSGAEMTARLDGELLDLHWVRRRGGVHHFVSERVPVAPDRGEAVLAVTTDARPATAQVRSVAWLPPGA